MEGRLPLKFKRVYALGSSSSSLDCVLIRDADYVPVSCVAAVINTLSTKQCFLVCFSFAVLEVQRRGDASFLHSWLFCVIAVYQVCIVLCVCVCMFTLWVTKIPLLYFLDNFVRSCSVLIIFGTLIPEWSWAEQCQNCPPLVMAVLTVACRM